MNLSRKERANCVWIWSQKGAGLGEEWVVRKLNARSRVATCHVVKDARWKKEKHRQLLLWLLPFHHRVDEQRCLALIFIGIFEDDKGTVVDGARYLVSPEPKDTLIEEDHPARVSLFSARS